MEGSPTRPASFGQLDPSVVNGSGAGPMAAVPAGGGPGGVPPTGGAGQGQGTAPGPAAFAMPTPQQPVKQSQFNPMPPGVAELNAPAESVLLTEMQELKDAFIRVRKITLIQGLALFSIGLALIFYLASKIQTKIEPEAI